MKHLVWAFTILILLSLFAGCGGGQAAMTLEPIRTLQYSIVPTEPADLSATGEPDPDVQATPVNSFLTHTASGNITQVWANNGGDKVTRDELRANSNPGDVINSVWDGRTISLSCARNEVVAFNLILEATSADAEGVNLSLASLDGPGGASITTRSAKSDDLFNFVGRNIELFYVRYLEIKGISTDLFFLGYDYDERHIPERCRRPYDRETGEGTGTWEDRPCHNKFYPDITVPLELHSPFTIKSGTNQSIWGDIYIPKTVPPGVYTGTITITEGEITTWQVPINLQVYNFTLPDLPNARTMLDFCTECINDRYLGEEYPEPGTYTYAQSLELANRHFQIAHRHKISLIDGYVEEIEGMNEVWKDSLSGELFTTSRGYDGIGVGVGNNVYSIGTYGSWDWQDGSKADMWANTDAWVNWFENQALTTPTDYFLYLIDESDDYSQIERWAGWINSNPGAGQRLMSMATIPLPTAAQNTPALDIPTSWVGVGITDEWENAATSYQTNSDKLFYLYNGTRPATGSFAIEDEGVALRALAWAQYKKKIDRWFYWEATYYNNFQGNTGQTNVFQQAQTYGDFEYMDSVMGETGWNYLNGDGVLLYPGTDTHYPEESYDVLGPFTSLRLKHWRRGIQDVDYLT
jgi:hypothetical protein